MDTDVILDKLEEMFPDARCELNHRNNFELLIAVMLSAQTTDASVNKVTPELFKKYPTAIAMSQADEMDVRRLIHNIGLYKNKAANVIKCSQQLVERFNGQVPSDMKQLTSLSGVGRKTANVVQGVGFDIPSMPVDTHVERVSKRLALAKEADTVEQIEKKLRRKLKRERWNKAHHELIFFGRYFCTARAPKCIECPFTGSCRYYKKKGTD